MVSLFVRLKLRLLRNVLKTPSGPGLVIFVMASITLGVSGAAFARSLDAAERVTATSLVAALLVASWLVSPLLFGANDETIDTTRLMLFDLNPTGVAAGMAAASVVGPGAVAAMIPLLGVASTAPSFGHMLLAVVAAFTVVLMATTGSRLALTVLGASLRRRRSRDLATIGAGISVGLLGVAAQAASFLDLGLDSDRIASMSRIAGLTPLGWAGNALGRASAGEILVPLILLGASLALTTLMMFMWIDVLARVLTEVDDTFVENAVGGDLLREHAMGEHRLGWAVLAKERRYLARHPRYRVQVISQLIVLIIGGAPFIEAILDRDPSSVLLGSIPGLTAGITGSNLLGPDGRGLWAEALALPSLRPLIRGRSLAFVSLGVSLSMIVTVLTAIYTGGWGYLLIAFAAGLTMALIGAGIGSITSTFAFSSYPDESAPNPFSSDSPGNGCLNGIITFTGMIIGLAASLPVLAGLAVADESTTVGLILLLGGPAGGTAFWLATTHVAGWRADRRTPEIVAALSGS